MSTNVFDLAVVGGGIIGLATAYRFAERFPDRRVVVLEKEAKVAAHQTGHNSGVIHSGIYYKPGSLKAITCRAGKASLERFCEEEGIPFERCGKVIVAINESELPRLQTLLERGKANGVDCTLIDRERLTELEPHVAGVQALHVPETGIVNYTKVCERLAYKVIAGGGEVRLATKVTGVRRVPYGVVVATSRGEVVCQQLVNCGGLQSDRLAALMKSKPPAKIVPFRGEYFEVRSHAQHLCRNLIYPVPDPSFPFLGVHFTRMIGGGLECGPNAVLAFAREGYRKRDVRLGDLAETFTYRGFLRLAVRHWRMGLGELWRSFSKQAFVKALQRLIPAVTANDLVPAPAGVRAQAVSPDGALIDDFLITENDRVVNVCNAPSPAATASLQIGSVITDRLAPQYK